MSAARRPEVLGPFLGYEARHFARSGRTYWLRFGFGLAILGVLAIGDPLIVGFDRSSGRGGFSASKAADLGKATFWMVAYAQLYVVAMLAPVVGAAALGDERDERTWGLLMLTPLSSLRIVVGKLVAKLFALELIVLSSLPFLALALVLGGVGPSELLTVTVHTQIVAVTGVAVGLLCSVVLQTSLSAAMVTYLFFAAVYVIPSLGELGAGSPLMAMVRTSLAPAFRLSEVAAPLAGAAIIVVLCVSAARPLFTALAPEQGGVEEHPWLLRWRRWSVAIALASGISIFGLLDQKRGGNFLGGSLQSRPDQIFGVLTVAVAASGFLAALLAIALPGRRSPAARSTSTKRPVASAAAVWNNPVAWWRSSCAARAAGCSGASTWPASRSWPSATRSARGPRALAACCTRWDSGGSC